MGSAGFGKALVQYPLMAASMMAGEGHTYAWGARGGGEACAFAARSAVSEEGLDKKFHYFRFHTFTTASISCP